MIIKVATPKGVRKHGEVRGGVFYREVSWEKDRMAIFNAWSLNPDALRQLENRGVATLCYQCGDDTYSISLTQVKAQGFEKEFAGGKTIYIPIEAWELNSDKVLRLPFKTKKPKMTEEQILKNIGAWV